MENDNLDSLLRHIGYVRENCKIVGEKLIIAGQEDLGISLIANGHVHDHSKFFGLERKFLNSETKEKDPDKFNLAYLHHICTNKHHPEYWPEGIKGMPKVYLAEWVCDVKSRSSEFGTDITEWLKGKGAKKYKYSLKSGVFKEIKFFLDLLLEPSFK